MATEVKSRGSIIYKILIVILSVALVATILYPKKLWKTEELNRQKCRENMEHILYAEYTYLNEFATFSDTLDSVINFIKSDTTGRQLRSFVNIDSLLTVKILDYVKTLDTTYMAIIDSLEDYGRLHGIDTTEALILDSLRTFPDVARKIDSIALFTLDDMRTCPTTHEDYIIQVVDTSAIKIVNIYCPIDSLDSVRVAQDFKLSKLGGLRISNHGSIENGEKSWAR